MSLIRNRSILSIAVSAVLFAGLAVSASAQGNSGNHLQKEEVTIANNAAVYNGAEQRPALLFNGVPMIEGFQGKVKAEGHYTLTVVYFNGDESVNLKDQSPLFVNAGTYRIHVSSNSKPEGLDERKFGNTWLNFTIAKAALTVTAENKEVAFGDDPPVYTADYNGFVNGEDESVFESPVKFECDYVKGSTGEYPITPCCAVAKNYEITYVAGKLTVGVVKEDDGGDVSCDGGKKEKIYDAVVTVTSYSVVNGKFVPVIVRNGETLVEGVDYKITNSVKNLPYLDDITAVPGTEIWFSISGRCRYNSGMDLSFFVKDEEVMSFGPNLLSKSDDKAAIFFSGKRIVSGSLKVYSSVGSVVSTISVSDKGGEGRREIGSWDLKDANGRNVAAGTYLAKGKVKLADGSSKKISAKISVK